MERILKVTFNKSGGTSSRNGVTTRLTLPTSWVKELGLTEKNREVIAKLEDGKIIIEPKK
ncbi:AbrB/MazE/SpoVT family DNA-binding domain-containing protein [Clostridium butyricum]|nr:AbrB/MazE/SpoVT family DNA-binding domain-containing protein [Clostridium butyricum]